MKPKNRYIKDTLLLCALTLLVKIFFINRIKELQDQLKISSDKPTKHILLTEPLDKFSDTDSIQTDTVMELNRPFLQHHNIQQILPLFQTYYAPSNEQERTS